MPAAITHYLQCQRVLEECRKNAPDVIVQGFSLDAFLWGAQGPDFLFTHRYLPWQKGESLESFGEMLHQTPPSRTLSVFREYYRGRENPVLLSYLYGFLCHYAADRTCHPFVNSGARELLGQHPEQTESIWHNQIESALDVILLRYERGALPVEFSLKNTVPKNGAAQEEIAKLYAFTLEKLYRKKADVPLLLQATGDCRLAFGLLNDRTSLKKNLVEKMEGKQGKRTLSCHIRGISEGDEYDYANTLHNVWSSPEESGAQHTESFFDLYEESIKTADTFVRGFLTCEDFASLTGDVSF